MCLCPRAQTGRQKRIKQVACLLIMIMIMIMKTEEDQTSFSSSAPNYVRLQATTLNAMGSWRQSIPNRNTQKDQSQPREPIFVSPFLFLVLICERVLIDMELLYHREMVSIFCLKKNISMQEEKKTLYIDKEGVSTIGNSNNNASPPSSITHRE